MDTLLRKDSFWERAISWGREPLARFLRDGGSAARAPRGDPTLLCRFPGFFAVQAILLVVTVSASVWTLHEHGERAAARRRLAALEHEFTALHATGVPEDATRIETEAARLEQAVSEWQAALAGGPPADAAETPSGRADAFFALARFVEQERRRAVDAGVRCREEERFGFAAYAQAGPDPEVIPFVHRQRRGAQPLLDAVWFARPARFDGLEREPPSRTMPADEGERTIADYFEPDPGLRLAGAGSLAFRGTFSGQTAALRAFLNRLADVSPGTIVRLVEVEPVRDPEAARDGDAPVVEAGFSRFVVTVEWVEWPGESLAEAP